MDTNTMNMWQVILAGGQVIGTVALVFLAFMTWRVYMKMTWLYGSLESHSLVMLRLAAHKARAKGMPVRLVWWDPDIASPPVTREHDIEDTIETIYLYLPQDQRKGWREGNRLSKAWRWLQAEI